MALSLGNIATDPSVSLLVLDTGTGAGVQVQGIATLVLRSHRTRAVTVLGAPLPVGTPHAPCCSWHTACLL
jgi:hypothetical protein